MLPDPDGGNRDGSACPIRRLQPIDLSAVEEHLLRLDVQDRQQRFGRAMSDAQLVAYARGIVWSRSVILGAGDGGAGDGGAGDGGAVVAIAEALFERSTTPHTVEVAITVDRFYRARGLGQRLIRHAIEHARLRGVAESTFCFRPENRRIQHIIRVLGGRLDLAQAVGSIPTCNIAAASAAAE